MHIKVDSEMRKWIFVLSVSFIIVIAVGLLLGHLDILWMTIKTIVSAAKAFFFGLLMAIVLRVPARWLEAHAFKNSKHKRMWSLVIVFVVFFLLLILLGIAIIPSIADSLNTFISDNAKYADKLSAYMKHLNKQFGISVPLLESGRMDHTFAKFIAKYADKIASFSISFIRGLINFIIASVAAFYMILDKEKLKKVLVKMNYGTFPVRTADVVAGLFRDALDIFDKYIVGTILDSIIIGVLCFIGVTLMKLPYAPMIAFIVGLTNVIPMFGPFLGAIPVAIILVLINPWYALFFLIFILALQQFDGNILKPIVLGDQLGLSGFWILFSVTVGGNLGGILGMFLGVPIFAFCYRELDQLFTKRIKDKKIDLDEDVTY
ncbi:AI-2E family transporter [Catenisphaera adipataccumulans]|uniref:Putative PurR-regulated permease PerM n=1 Tax=Catenisphaera adipataccumulans TaxID=700500 RepID=A0A7W8CXZ0_9FIRM|nr:AI-2E family transporter [Catenisphaera adipataccumulans]MBB5183675.1 putative PurR-regulated permease PerM [Catenisphaera adipataccumulans]